MNRNVVAVAVAVFVFVSVSAFAASVSGLLAGESPQRMR